MSDPTTSLLSSYLPQGVFDETALPLYGRVANRMLADLRDSSVRKGDKLPSERLLSERYGVSRVTLRSALNELRRLGVLSSAAARGWFVEAVEPLLTAPAGSRPGATVQGFADSAASRGLRAEATVLATLVRPCSVEESTTLRIAPGAALFELRRLRFLDGLVVVSEWNRIPLQLAPTLPTIDFCRASLYTTFRNQAPPQIPCVADYSVEARRPSPDECAQLQIEDATPLLVATQLSYNEAGRPLDLTVAAYRGDRYRFTASITNQSPQ
jgi:GntR family transcriptional regulator